MGSTKIINVLKNDRFEDVLDAFQKAEAEEVILIFPKNSKLSKKEAHFASLANEAEEAGKQITIMTADENIKSYAKKYGFRFLAQAVKNKKIPSKVKDEEEETPAGENSIQDIQDENEKDSGDEKDDTAMAELAMAGARTYKPKLSGKKPDKLENIWLRKEAKPAKSFWSGFNSDLIKRGRGHKKLNLILISSAVAVLFLTIFIFLGNAQVIIKPQKQKLGFELPISVLVNIAQVDTVANKIPGQFLSFRSDVSKDFAATGEKEVVQKARGEITVFNNFNSDPQSLVATTRFESSKGLIFRIPRPIVIPGAKLVNGKLVPGSIIVEVLADKSGQEYNINADRFSIPGFAANKPKFEGFYAESSKPMAGGKVGLSKVVTEKDFTSAKDAVIKEALGKSLENLKNKSANLEVVQPVTNEIVALKSTAETDDAAEGFAIAATAEAKTIGFSKEDLYKTIGAYINKNGNLVLLKDSLNVDYKNIKFDFAKNTLSFSASVKGEAAAKIDEEKIINNLLGLKKDKIKDYLSGIKEIESARVVLSPFWVQRVPKNRQNVRINIVY